MVSTFKFRSEDGFARADADQGQARDIDDVPDMALRVRIENRWLQEGKTRSLKFIGIDQEVTDYPRRISIDSDTRRSNSTSAVPSPEDHLLHALVCSIASAIAEQATLSGVRLEAVNSVAFAELSLGTNEAEQSNPGDRGQIRVEVTIDADASDPEIQRVFQAGVANSNVLPMIDRRLALIVGLAT